MLNFRTCMTFLQIRSFYRYSWIPSIFYLHLIVYGTPSTEGLTEAMRPLIKYSDSLHSCMSLRQYFNYYKLKSLSSLYPHRPSLLQPSIPCSWKGNPLEHNTTLPHPTLPCSALLSPRTCTRSHSQHLTK